MCVYGEPLPRARAYAIGRLWPRASGLLPDVCSQPATDGECGWALPPTHYAYVTGLALPQAPTLYEVEMRESEPRACVACVTVNDD